MQPAADPDFVSATCPTHGGPATNTCRRCGGFYCDTCWAVGGTCAACLERKTAAQEPMYFGASATRFTVLSLVTFGMFPLVWQYRNWRLERDRGEDVSPFWRTFFSIFFIHSLLSRMNRHAQDGGIQGVAAGWRAAAYILMSFAASVPSVGGLFALLSFAPLVGGQKLSNRLNARYAPGAPAKTPLTAGNIVFLVLPIVLVLLGAVAGVALAVAEAEAGQ